MKKLFLALGVFVLLAAAAGSAVFVLYDDGPRTPVMVEPPDYIPEGKMDYPEESNSQIAVRLELPMEALAAAANRSAPKEISGKENKNFHERVQNGTVQYRMLPGDISLQNTGQELGFTLPIRGVAQVAGDVDLIFIRLPVQGTADLAGQIAGTVRPRISSDWEIFPNLNPLLKLSHANLTLGKIGTISATKMVEDLANPVIQKEAENIGPSIMKGLELKKKLQLLWDQAHRGEQVSEDPPAWFVFDPGEVSMGPVDYSNREHLSVTMGMVAHSYISSVPVNTSYPETLPPLNLTLTDPVNDIQFPVVVDVAELNKKMAVQRFTQSIGVGGTAEISAPELRVGQNGGLVFGVTVDADTGRWGQGFAGRIWFEADPQFDYETQRISLNNMKLTDKTRRALPRPAVKMIEKMVSKSIEKALQENLERYPIEMKAGIETFLNSGKLPDDVSISIPNPDFKIIKIYTVTRTTQSSKLSPGVVVVLGARGDVVVRLKSL